MDNLSLHPTYFGESLLAAINTVQPERKALIENFLYEKSAVMLYADDGVGKSVLVLQACMQATVKESKVYGEFNVPEARNVLYFQMERHPDESFERMRHLQHVLPFNKNKFALSVALQGTNLQDSASRAAALGKIPGIIKEIGFTPEIVAFDPIYTLAQDGLETAQACNAITSFFRVIQLYLNCCLLVTSHTNRGVRDIDNPGRRVGKDMYGNRFLSAFFTGSYHVSSKSEGAGAIFKLDKNSQKNLEPKFETIYDPSNYCSLISGESKFTKEERLSNYLKACKNLDKEFTFEDIQSNTGLSDSGLRRHLSGYPQEKLKTVSKDKYGKKLYKFLG